MKAMRWLRSCGVRNVNVLIDGHYYAQLMQQLGGEEMNLAPAYSLYPVFGSSIFHPKIWMLFGKNEGMLVIGSGNLTNSGNGNNEEIWGAFHFDTRSSENALIFSTAWNYVQKLCAPIKGYTYEKTNHWLLENSKWLGDLPPSNGDSFYEVSGKDKVAFLYNSSNGTIFQKLSDLIGKERIVEITTVSPYYDKRGNAIRALSEIWPESKINVVIDESGTVPYEIPLSKNLHFFNWYDLGISKAIYSKSDEHSELSKLHAKIIHFKVDSGKEFLLFGSANVTPEGLGLPGKRENEEASLLIESPEGGLLKNLGIKLKSPVGLSEFNVKSSKTVFEIVVSSNRKKINLLVAEVIFDEIFVYAIGNYSGALVVKIFDKDGRVLHSIELDSFSEEIRIKLTLPKEANHVELYDESGNSSQSNKVLLSDHVLLAKTHPNPKTEEIERIFQDIQGGDLTKVLDLLQYALLDETEGLGSSKLISRKSPNEIKSAGKEELEKLYELSGFKTKENQSQEKGLLIFSNSLRVLDALRFVSSVEFIQSNQSELKVDEQEASLDKTPIKEGGGIETQLITPLWMLNAERRKLLAYLNKTYDHQHFLLYSKNKPKDYKVSLTDLSKYLIAIELLLGYGGKIEKYIDGEDEEYFTYLEFLDDLPYHSDSVKGWLFYIIGEFLLIVKAGFKKYELEYTQNKMQQLKADALVDSLICILNMKWKENEKGYAKSMILNCLHYLGGNGHEWWRIELPHIKSRLEVRMDSVNNQSNMLNENYRWLLDEIIPLFLRAIHKLSSQEFETKVKRGQTIYKSHFGYCEVKNISSNNELILVRPGFIWDEMVGDFIRHNDDVDYQPLYLKKFLIVD
ncbi:phospholipase D-like domain-containing protein [Algoriphagus aquaeductus]|nr:hypothetical protein [Algoriphagus aquaeductus]